METAQAKGIAFTGVIELAKRAVPGGLDAVLERLSDDDRDYFGKLFVAAGWDDLVRLEQLMRAAAEGVDRRAADGTMTLPFVARF